MTLTDKAIWGKKQKQKQRRRTEKRGQEKGKCREEEKLLRGRSVRAAMGSQVRIILWTVSPVIMEAGGMMKRRRGFPLILDFSLRPTEIPYGLLLLMMLALTRAH